MATSCSIARWPGTSNTLSRWPIWLSPIACTGWKSVCSLTTMKASDACVRRLNPRASRRASMNIIATVFASCWTIAGGDLAAGYPLGRRIDGVAEDRRAGGCVRYPRDPARGGAFDCIHFILATTNSPWAEMFMPPPGGPDEVYKRFEEENHMTRGPEGIYARPSDRPGLGWDIEVLKHSKWGRIASWCAGTNRHRVTNERVVQERSSEPS